MCSSFSISEKGQSLAYQSKDADLPASSLIIGSELFFCPAPISSMELSRRLAFAAPPGARLRDRVTAYSGPGTVTESYCGAGLLYVGCIGTNPV